MTNNQELEMLTGQKPEEKTQLLEHLPVEYYHDDGTEVTPFKITGNKETGYFLRFGKYQLTENFKTPTDCQTYLNLNQWEIITKLIITIIDIDKTKTP